MVLERVRRDLLHQHQVGEVVDRERAILDRVGLEKVVADDRVVEADQARSSSQRTADASTASSTT